MLQNKEKFISEGGAPMGQTKGCCFLDSHQIKATGLQAASFSRLGYGTELWQAIDLTFRPLVQ